MNGNEIKPAVKFSLCEQSTQMEDYIIHNHQYGIIICRQHKYAVPKNWIRRHFQEQHKDVPLETRQNIEAYVADLNLLPPSEVPLPESTIPVEGLALYNGYKCLYDECDELKGTVKSMVKHCKYEHKWIKSVGVKWTAQAMQTFFVSSHLKYISFNCS